MKRWKITYQYPPEFEKEFVSHFVDQKYKPNEIHERHRFVGVLAVKIEQIFVDPQIWILKDTLQSLLDAYNTYTNLENYDKEEAKKILDSAFNIELRIHQIEGNIFTIQFINEQNNYGPYIVSTNLKHIKK